MRAKTSVVVLLSVTLTMSCAELPRNDAPLTAGEDSPLIRRARSEAQPCADRAAGKLKLSADFKYGCFCGLGHPQIAVPPEPMTDAQRDEVVAQYYRIEPWDDVDRACREHDVCWVLRGEGDGRCNEQLDERLRSLGKTFKTSDTQSKGWRCHILSSDISLLFSTGFVPARYDNWGTQIGHEMGAFIATVVLVPLTALLRPIVWVNHPYPLAEERCVA